MSTAPVQRGTCKPRMGRTWKRLRRIQIVCELEAQFIPDADIARHLGITVGALHHIKITPEYASLKISKQTGIMSVYEKMRLTPDEIKSEMDDMFPLAMRNIKTALVDAHNPYHMKVSMDMLDRNESTLKISRIKNEHDLSKVLDTSKENIRARELLAMLEGDAPSVLDAKISPVDYRPNVGLLEADISPGTLVEEPDNMVSEEDDSINNQTFFDRDEANGV